MFTSVIVLAAVLAVWIVVGGFRPPWALQPATGARRRVGASAIPAASLAFAVPTGERGPNLVVESLRTLGLVRRGVPPAVVGPKAYVRLWERLRAIVVLTAIVVTIGVVLAGVIGIAFLAAGYLLEQAIA